VTERTFKLVVYEILPLGNEILKYLVVGLRAVIANVEHHWFLEPIVYLL